MSKIEGTRSALQAALKDPNSSVKIQAAVALARKHIFSDEIASILVTAIGNQRGDNLLRGNAAWVLGEQSTALSAIEGAQSALEAALEDPNSRVKIEAAVALARKNVFSKEVTLILVEVVGNNQYDNVLRGHAAYALNLKPELLKKENIRSTLEAALNDSDSQVKNYASEALKKYERAQQGWRLPFLNF